MKPQHTVVDHAQLAQLYQQHAPKILDYVSRQTSSSHDAEDILIDVFVAALESVSFASLTEQEQQAWLWRVARNKVIDLYRRTRRMPLKNIDDHEFIEDAVMSPEQISIRQEEDDNLALLLRRLTPLQQQVLYLRFGENLRCAQIASLLEPCGSTAEWNSWNGRKWTSFCLSSNPDATTRTNNGDTHPGTHSGTDILCSID